MPIEDVVALLGVPHLSRIALWWLVWIGRPAAPAVRAGLSAPNPLVRRACCEFFEHWSDPQALPDLEALLSDPDADVRRVAAHTLTCDHCRNGTWATKRLQASVVP
jgi:HEAT repeat protein